MKQVNIQPDAHRGSALIYTMVAMVAFCGIVSLGVDLAHVQTTKTELQLAADAAARAAASHLLTSNSNAQAAAIAAAAGNKADGSAVVLVNADVEIGNWNSTSKKFKTSGTQNAIRVTAARTSAKGNAVPLMFTRLLGRSSCDVTAVAVAALNTGWQRRGGANGSVYEPVARRHAQRDLRRFERDRHRAHQLSHADTRPFAQRGTDSPV